MAPAPAAQVRWSGSMLRPWRGGRAGRAGDSKARRLRCASNPRWRCACAREGAAPGACLAHGFAKGLNPSPPGPWQTTKWRRQPQASPS